MADFYEDEFRRQGRTGYDEGRGYRPPWSYDEESGYTDRGRDRWQREGGRGDDQESDWRGGRQVGIQYGRRVASSRDYGYTQARPGSNFSNPGWYQGGPEGSNANYPGPYDQDRGYGRDSRYSRYSRMAGQGSPEWGEDMGGESGETERRDNRSEFRGEFDRGRDYNRGGYRPEDRGGYGNEWNFGAYDPYGEGQSYGGQQYGQSRGYAGIGPRGYQRSDDRLMEDICDRLTQHSGIDATDIEVQVRDGEVTLAGMVPNRHQKRMAEDSVESVYGVKDISNQLRLSPAGANVGEDRRRASAAFGGDGGTMTGTDQPRYSSAAEASGGAAASSEDTTP